MSVLIKDLKLPKGEVLLIYSDGEVRTEDWVKYSAVEVPDDVQPVVRCKDCKHRDPEDRKCDCGELARAGCIFPVNDDYFCAYGARKDGEP